METFLKIAHRGASGQMPENTLSAFKKAIELKADIIELDVHLCKTGQLIVIHDETVDRTTNGQGKVSKKTIDEINGLKITGGEKIPTLDKVIDLTKGKCRLNIEIKNKKAAKKVFKTIRERNIEEVTMISSNSARVLRYLFKSGCAAQLALIFYATKSDFRQNALTFFSLLLLPLTHYLILRRANQGKVQWINLMKPLAHKKFIKLLHYLNYKVAIWTVNKPSMIKKLRRLGVDAIMSDFPKLLLGS